MTLKGLRHGQTLQGKFALRGSIVILGAWVLFFLAVPIADAIGEDAELIFRMFWIFIFYGLALATLIFAPIFAV